MSPGALRILGTALLPPHPDRRWLLGREDAPWYPTVRLFRRGGAGERQVQVRRVRGTLEAWLARRA